VLPGFTPNNKILMLQQLKDELEIMMVLNAKDLEQEKIRADLGITYQDEAMRLIDIFRDEGFMVEHLVITQLSADYSNALALATECSAPGSKSPTTTPPVDIPLRRKKSSRPKVLGKISTPKPHGRWS